MSRLFNELLYEGWVKSTVEIFTDPTYNEMLGEADSLRIQILSTDYTGTTPQITTTYYHSCDNRTWETLASRATTVSTTPEDSFTPTASGVNMGYGRIGLVIDDNTKKAYVKIYAVGRSN